MRCALLLSVIGVGCGSPTSLLPDGGRGRVVCSVSVLSVPVKVLDPTGAPIAEASVVATNVSDGRVQMGRTNGSGVFVITSELGPGVISVKASVNDLTSPEGQFTVTPSDCTPAVSPNNVVLQLK